MRPSNLLPQLGIGVPGPIDSQRQPLRTVRHYIKGDTLYHEFLGRLLPILRRGKKSEPAKTRGYWAYRLAREFLNHLLR